MASRRLARPARRVLLGSLVVAATLALGACGDDDDDEMEPATDADITEGDGSTDGAGQTSMPAPGTVPGGEIDLSPIAYEIPLTVEEEIPAPVNVPDGAGGTASLVFDPATRGMTGTITTGGLTGTPTMAHIHEQAAGDDIGPPIIFFVASGDGTGDDGFELPADTVLNEEQAESLETGLLYVNVHTAANPEGEVRGQIVRQDPDDSGS